MEKEQIVSRALMIVGGYAFMPNAGNVCVTHMQEPCRSTLMRPNGEVLETSMEDVELEIVGDLWRRNRNLYEEMSNA